MNSQQYGYGNDTWQRWEAVFGCGFMLRRNMVCLDRPSRQAMGVCVGFKIDPIRGWLYRCMNHHRQRIRQLGCNGET